MAITIVTPHPTTKAAYSWLGVRTLNPQWNGIDPSTQYIPVNLDLTRQEYRDAFIPEVNGDLATKDWNKTPQHTVDQTKLALVFSRWGSVINLNNGNEQISFAYVSLGDLSGTTYLGGGTYFNKNVIFFNDSLPSNPTGFNTYDLTVGTWGGWTAMHEIGHVLGLSHSASPAPLVYDFRNSIMDYPARGADLKIDPNIKIPLTPGMIDISALQSGLYGFSNASNGTDTYTFTDNSINFTASTPIGTQASPLSVTGSPSKYVMTIWDRGGTDTINAVGMTSDNYIDLNAGKFSSIGSNVFSWPVSSADTRYNVGIAYGASIENATGGSARDNIIGNALANNLNGGAGNDSLEGKDGNDIINGGTGNDFINGGAGNDVMNGGLGTDSFFGLTGADRFVFDSFNLGNIDNDTIHDFSRVELDKIDLSIIDANTNIIGNQAFSFVGYTALATGAAGRLNIQASNNGVAGSTLYGDVNGDGTADFHIVLTGITSVLASDIIL